MFHPSGGLWGGGQQGKKHSDVETSALYCTLAAKQPSALKAPLLLPRSRAAITSLPNYRLWLSPLTWLECFLLHLFVSKSRKFPKQPAVSSPVENHNNHHGPFTLSKHQVFSGRVHCQHQCSCLWLFPYFFPDYLFFFLFTDFQKSWQRRWVYSCLVNVVLIQRHRHVSLSMKQHTCTWEHLNICWVVLCFMLSFVLVCVLSLNSPLVQL